MSFEFWRWTRPALLPRGAGEYILLTIYVLATAVLFFYARRDFKRLNWRRLPLFIGLLASPLLANNLLLIHLPFSNLLPPPGLPFQTVGPFVALLGALPIIVTAAWLGAGPALLVGLLSGFWRTGMMTGGITDPFSSALCGFLLGFFLRQDYRGPFPLIMRQPIVGGPLATLLASPLLLLSVFVHAIGAGLSGLDYAVTLTGASLASALLETFVAAAILQSLYLVPRLRPVRAAYRFAPYTRTLNRRMLLLVVPLIVAMTIGLIYAVTAVTLRVAVLEVVDEMGRNASSAAVDVANFVQDGQSLLTEFANDEALRQSDPATLEARLQGDMRTLVFFNQLALYGLDGRQLAMYPPPPAGDPELTEQEEALLQRAIENGSTEISAAHSSRRSEDEVILTFLSPVEDEAGNRYGVLLGRTLLTDNPVIARILQSLQWIRARGEGFIVDTGKGVVVAHSDPAMLLTAWRVDENSPAIPVQSNGQAYESRNPRDNTRQLVYYLPVEGYPSWAVVIRLPYEVVLEQTRQIATPLLFIQVLLGGVLVVVIPLVTGWLTRPLKQLAAAAGRIAEGDLKQPVQVSGNDEVAQVGEAFEGMRVRLKDRLEDLSLLLRISQAVSAMLELPQGMPYILEGVLKATGALVARIVLLSATGDPQMVMARGEPREGLGILDRSLTTAARDLDHPLVVENLARARTLAEPWVLEGPLKAVIALPVRTKDQVPAVMWAGYGEVHQFDAAEIDLLSTLAGQTAVLVENARLFQAAEGGRRRLAAILTSTTDAVLVTDRDDRILLVNPAAERTFGIVADGVVGKKVNEAGLAPALTRVFERPLSASESLSEEVPLPNGRTLYASVSTILSANGERIGRVAVMRDVTRFKELDELKSEFVATVSHDLRAPLTFMRGYATMLPMVGDLSEKQRDYIEKILHGVGQMSELIDDLLDLGRIEAGVGLERKPCHLGTILVEAVDGMRMRATAKGLTLQLQPPEGVAVVAGDVALLRQVVTNLVDNAIKYTPGGGSVTVGLAVHDDHAIIRVTDTGIGIAPDDQVRLFEKFFRIRRRDTQDIPGSGLGLAIVKSIVERHGGRVWVESELDKGSMFCVSLPLGATP
jgi:PAS domain S-box-containing protein